jgi:hypothetical protein
MPQHPLPESETRHCTTGALLKHKIRSHAFNIFEVDLIGLSRSSPL